MLKCKDIVESQLKDDVILQFEFGEFLAGKHLFTEVFTAIQHSDISIFDISENNPNVLIEVGMAHGNSNYVILLKNNLSQIEFRVPSDINGCVYVPYDHIESDDVYKNIAKPIISNYFKDFPKDEKYFSSIWGFNSENDQVLIICSELDNPSKLQEPIPGEFNYLGKYGDSTSLLLILSSLYRIYPKLSIKYCTSKEYENRPLPYNRHLIFLGGPFSNTQCNVFLSRTEYEYVKNAKGETILRNNKKKVYFRPEITINNGSEHVEDFGLFIKMANPYNPDKNVFLINGTHGYGTFGASRCFSYFEEHLTLSRKNCMTAFSCIGDQKSFAAVLKVTSVDKNISIPEVKKSDIFCLKS